MHKYRLKAAYNLEYSCFLSSLKFQNSEADCFIFLQIEHPKGVSSPFGLCSP